MRDVIDVPGREEYVTHMEQKNGLAVQYQGCLGGVCKRQKACTKKSVSKTNTNPTPQPNDVTHAIMSCQIMNYEDEEEELNLWIWRSNTRMTR